MGIGKTLASLGLVAVLSGCGAIDRQIAQEDSARLVKNRQICESYSSARTITGVVVNAMYTPEDTYVDESGRCQGRATLLVTPNGETNTILRFDYREDRQFVSPIWDDFDIGIRDIVLFNKPGTTITWKNGFRPYDIPVEHKNGYRNNQPLVEVWPCARFKQ